MKKLLLILVAILALMADKTYAQVPVGEKYTFVYNLRTQYRRFNVDFTEKGDTLMLNWNIKMEMYLVTGSYQMLPEARLHATQNNYVMPAPMGVVPVPAHELFALLSADALRDVKSSGKCQFNNTTLVLIDKQTSSLDSQKTTLHLKDFDEGYEVWVRDDERFPLIEKMINNPVEIDWEVIKQ